MACCCQSPWNISNVRGTNDLICLLKIGHQWNLWVHWCSQWSAMLQTARAPGTKVRSESLSWTILISVVEKINGKRFQLVQAVKSMHDCINMHSSCLNASTLNTRIAQETNVIRAAGPEFPVATSFGTARCASFSYLGINSGKTIFSIKWLSWGFPAYSTKIYWIYIVPVHVLIYVYTYRVYIYTYINDVCIWYVYLNHRNHDMICHLLNFSRATSHWLVQDAFEGAMWVRSWDDRVGGAQRFGSVVQ